MAIAIQNQTVNTLDTTEALWSLIIGQKKSVQKTLADRLTVLLKENKRKAQEKYVRESLTRALAEVRQAREEGRSLPDARSLLDELED